MSDIFDPTDSELDPEIQAAALLLEKYAADAGLDLNAMPEEEFVGLLHQIAGSNTTPVGDDGTNQVKEASMEQQQIQLTPQDVHLELTKVAAAEGVDINTVSREEYHELFNAMVQEMQDPAYAEKVAAEEAAMAEAYANYEAGDRMADAFLLKLAAADIVTEEQLKQAGVRDAAKRVWEGTKNMARQAGSKAKELEGRASDAVGRAAGNLGPKADRQSTGRRVLGAMAATGTVGVGAGAAMRGGKKKEASDEEFTQDVLKVASDILVANGINPETFEPLEQPEPSYEDQVKIAAFELLTQHGFEIK